MREQQPIYMHGHSVVKTLIKDANYDAIAIVYDEDLQPFAGLFKLAVTR